MRIAITDSNRTIYICTCRTDLLAEAFSGRAARAPTAAIFADALEATMFIRRCVIDRMILSRLREALSSTCYDLTMLSDNDVIHAAASLVACGAWHVRLNSAATPSLKGALFEELPLLSEPAFSNSATLTEERLCFPISAFQTPNFAAGFGLLAERLIQDDYRETARCPPTSVYFDNSNPTEYRRFLKSHNPSLTDTAIAEAMRKAVRPDILRHDGSAKEYYEIKPMSLAGVRDGKGKLEIIMQYMRDMKLPYAPGVIYAPSKDIPVMGGEVLGSAITVAINVQLAAPGVLLYRICLKGNLAELLKRTTIKRILKLIVAQCFPG